MTDADNSDDERYANESFENESDTEVPEISEFDSESTTQHTSDEEDDEDENIHTVKLNTGPIKRNKCQNNIISSTKSDAIPYASSSDEDDDVIVGETLAEINTPSILFEDKMPTPTSSRIKTLSDEDDNQLKNSEKEEEEETRVSSEEISEEEDIEDEELKKIKEMEEKYLQQILAKSGRKDYTENATSLEEKIQKNILESSENGSESEGEDSKKDEISEDNVSRVSSSSELQSKFKDSTGESEDQLKLLQLIQQSLKNLETSSSNFNEDDIFKTFLAPSLNETNSQTCDTSKMNESEKIAFAIVSALRSTALTNLEVNDKPKTVEQTQELVAEEIKESDTEAGQLLNVANSNENNKNNNTEIVPFTGDFKEEENNKLEELQNTNGYHDDHDISSDDQLVYRISSTTPTSFNSDDHIFHANFVKQFHRTSSTDQLKAKPYPRKSMSFSNERMREIERHNQILLRKILTQKPTYVVKSKPSQASLQKLPSQSNVRLTNSAVNRKKQQRQINIDNQVLKRKIEAISMRRRPSLMS